jgi:hypothetical protein
MSHAAEPLSVPEADQIVLSDSDLHVLLQLSGEHQENSGGSELENENPARHFVKIAPQKLSRPGAELARWIEEYARIGHRNPYLWGWCRRAVEITTLPCIDPAGRGELCDTKTLGVMLDVLLDDVADRGGDICLLERLLAIIETGDAGSLSGLSLFDREYVDLAERLWNEVISRTERYPKAKEYADLLRYDYRQLCNVMRYSHLSNRCPEMLNEAEHDLYTPHNMHIMICSTIDLMASPAFDRQELGRVRELMWHAQCMGRIGNLVTTWEREVKERDFTSGVFARAVSSGELTVEQLLHADVNDLMTIVRGGGFERYYLDRWQAHRKFLLERGSGLKSFDIRQLVEGFEALICLHLASRGKK